MNFKLIKILHKKEFLKLKKIIKENSYSKIDSIEEFNFELINHFKKNIDWYIVSESYNLSDCFLRRFQEEINWERLSFNIKQKFSDDIVEEFFDHLNICILHDRKLISDNIKNIFSNDIKNKLEERNKKGGIILTPYIFVQRITCEFKPRKNLRSRYSIKKVNSNFYTQING